MDIDFMPGYKCWFGAQDEFTMTDKYAHKRLVKWGKPLIWLSNYNPCLAKSVDRDWMEKNTVVVYVGHKLSQPQPVQEAMVYLEDL